MLTNIKRKINNIVEYLLFLGAPGISPDDMKILKSKKSSDRLFIIGSGPSINSQPIEALKDSDTIAFNAFYRGVEKWGFLPTYYLIEDVLPAEDNATNIKLLANDTCLVLSRDCAKFYSDVNHIPVALRKYSSHWSRENWPKFQRSSQAPLYWGGTVTYMALQLAVILGYKEVVLLGIDLTYNLPVNYKGGVITSQDNDQNHFDPNYFGKGLRWHDPNVNRMQKSLLKAEKEMVKTSVKLFNATNGGNLKYIKRIKLEDLI